MDASALQNATYPMRQLRRSASGRGWFSSRLWSRLGAVAIAAVAVTGCGSDDAVTTQTNRSVDPTAIAAPVGPDDGESGLTLEVVDGGSATGLVMTNYLGFALYGLRNETPEALVCGTECAKVWIPVTPRDGGVNPALDESLYRTIVRPDGVPQAVYNDIALYQWTGDSRVGITQGAGVAGTWFAMTEAANFSVPG